MTWKKDFKIEMPDPPYMFDGTDEGCWFDSALGQYIGEEVIKLAEKMGMKIELEDEINKTGDGEFYSELWDEAENYLNNNCAPSGYYFGGNDSCDWGLWKNEDEDEDEDAT